MNKLLGLFVCLAVVCAAQAQLQCYSCRSANIKDCTTDNAIRTKLQCPRPADPKQSSVCVYKLTHDKVKNTDDVYASCAQIPSNSPISRESANECRIDTRDPNSPNLEIKECRVCNTELCNSASMFSKSLFTILCLPVMYLFAKSLY